MDLGTIYSSPRAPADPVPDEFVFRHRGLRGLADFDQAAVPQQANGLLHGGFGQTGKLRQCLQTDGGRALFGPEQLSPQYDVNQECRGRAVVADEVRQEHVQNIIVDGNMVHRTIVQNI